jgi:PBP1b-binding outer membrane lipoprotein LpoB
MTRSAPLAAALLAALLLAACSSHSAAPAAPKPTASQPAVSVSGCTSAMEKVGMTTLVTDAGGTYPPAVTRACDGLSPAAMSSAVNQAMSYLMSAPSGT